MGIGVCRLEPLIEAGAEQRRPVYASLSGGGRRLHVGLTEVGEVRVICCMAA